MRGAAVSEEHVPQHLLGHLGGAGVADEEGAELALSQGAERHVLPHDLAFVAVLVGDGVERDMGVGRLDVVGEFHVGELRAPDDLLLLVRRQRVPRPQVVQVLLDDHITAALEGGVLFADEHGVGGRPALGVLAAVDEAEQVAVVEVLESMDFVDDRDRAVQSFHDQPGEFEAEVHAAGPEVEQEVSRRGRGPVAPARQLGERVQLLGARPAEQPVPGRRSDADDAAEVVAGCPEGDGTAQSRDILQQATDRVLAPRRDGDHEEHGGPGRSGDHSLRLGRESGQESASS